MKNKIAFVIIWLCVTCILFYFTYPFKSDNFMNYIPNSFVKSRNVSIPLDAHVLDSLYSDIFNLNAEVNLPASLPEFRNPCWYFRLYENVTTMYEDKRHFGTYSYGHKNLLNFRDSELVEMYKNNKSQLKCLPQVYLIGFPKCASTDFYFRLTSNQQVFAGTVKEYHWWTKKRGNDIDLDVYMHQFDIAANNMLKSCSSETKVAPCVTVDGSPSTVFYNGIKVKAIDGTYSTPEAESLTPGLLKRLLPTVQILVIMKNPTERLHSEFFCFQRTKVRNPEVFHEAATNSVKLMKECISVNGPRQCAYNHTLRKLLGARLQVGMYYIFVNDWLTVFPRNQIFALTTEEYSSQTNTVLNKVTNFLHLEPHSNVELENLEYEHRRNQHSKGQPNSSVTMLGKTKRLLDEFYQPFNNKLAELLGDSKFKWTETTE